MKESLKFLQRCAEIQVKKSNDYQNPNSRVKQADYYPRGCATSRYNVCQSSSYAVCT